MNFVSLVGTQIIAILNPLLAYFKSRSEDLHNVFLLATKKSEEYAERIREHLYKHRYIIDKNIHIFRISDSSQADSEGHPPAHEAFRSLLNLHRQEPFLFNLAGGINFQIASCILACEDLDRLRFVYPEMRGVHLFKLEEGGIRRHEILKLPDPVDVLGLQGINYTIKHGEEPPLLKYYRRRCNFKMDSYIGHISIGDVDFEIVFNVGNNLSFFKTIDSSKTKGKSDKSYFLREARKLISVAVNRSPLSELYHRNIGLLTNHHLVADRVEREGGGKIEIFFHKDTSSIGNICEKLRKFFRPENRSHHSRNLKTVDLASRASGESLLFLALGRNIVPTLSAMYSHRAKTINFLFTPSDKKITTYCKSLRRNLEHLPGNTYNFIPVSITGHEILSYCPPNDKKLSVNITPGTKAQAAFLAYWAKCHNINVYSIKTGADYLVLLPDKRGPKFRAPSPHAILLNSGVEILEEGEDQLSIQEKFAETGETILEFFRELIRKKEDIKRFPHRRIDFKNAVFENKNGQGTIRLNGKEVRWTIDSTNRWFERLVGFSLLRAGADRIAVRVRTKMDKENALYLQQKHDLKHVPHMTDIDVVAQFGGDYYVVSCKISEKKKTRQLAEEVVAMATIIGRFAIPMVCFLKYAEKPHREKNTGVYIFGYKTLCNNKAMKELLERAVKEKRKTGH